MTDGQFELVQRLRVTGPLKIEALVEDREGVGDEIRELVGDGVLLEAAGHVALTEAGKERHSEELAARVDQSALAEIGERYDRDFLPLNREFKRLCAEWQEEERFELVEKAADVHERLNAGFLDAVSPGAPNLRVYRPRFERALESFLDGEGSALTAPTANSYHGVWFELHEDLIVTLGRNRSEEEAAEAGSS